MGLEIQMRMENGQSEQHLKRVAYKERGQQPKYFRRGDTGRKLALIGQHVAPGQVVVPIIVSPHCPHRKPFILSLSSNIRQF